MTLRLLKRILLYLQIPVCKVYWKHTLNLWRSTNHPLCYIYGKIFTVFVCLFMSVLSFCTYVSLLTCVSSYVFLDKIIYSNLYFRACQIEQYRQPVVLSALQKQVFRKLMKSRLSLGIMMLCIEYSCWMLTINNQILQVKGKIGASELQIVLNAKRRLYRIKKKSWCKAKYIYNKMFNWDLDLGNKTSC